MSRFRALVAAGAPILFAHRGDSAYAPENTLDAALRGHARGATAWELDVRLSRDGVPFVLHDETLGRTTDAAERFRGDPRAALGLRASDFDWDEIRALDAGSWFVAPEGGYRSASAFGTLGGLPAPEVARFGSGAVRVPSLAEALALTRDLDWLVNVELKGFPEHQPGLVPAVLAEVDRAGMADRVVLSSFDHGEVARIARARPEIASGALIGPPLHAPARYVRELVGADFLHASAEALGSDAAAYRGGPSAATLRMEDAATIPTFVYTVNDAGPEGLAAHLLRGGAAGIFSDRPGDLLPLLPGRARDAA